MTTVTDKVEETLKERLTDTSTLGFVATTVYDLFNAPWRLSTASKLSYDRMLREWRACVGSEYKLPQIWALSHNNRPIEKFPSFKNVSAMLKSNLIDVNKCDPRLNPEIQGIVSNIARLFESLSKRSLLRNPFSGYRHDGVEAMMLIEMADWLTGTLPKLSVTDSRTADEVKRRIKYCAKIRKHVFGYIGDEDIANPKKILTSIIDELKVVQIKLELTSQAATFVDRVDSVDKQISNLISGTFNILHLMIKGVDQDVFQIRQFLSLTDERKKKTAALQATLLGKWLIKTCKAAGMTASGFDASIDLSYSDIVTHIDIDTDMKGIKSVASIGIDDFVWDSYQQESKSILDKREQDYLKKAAPEFLSLVAALHRSILELSHFRKVLATSTCVSVKYGQKWLFDKDNGDPIVAALIFSIKNVIQKHESALEKFWKVFYDESFTPYETKNNLDKNSQVHSNVETAFDFYTENKRRLLVLLDQVKNIQAYSDDVQADSKHSADQRILLTRQLHEMVSKSACPDQSVLDGLQRLMGKLDDEEQRTAPFGQEDKDRAEARAIHDLCKDGDYSADDLPYVLYKQVYSYFLEHDDDHPNIEPSISLRREYEAAIAAAKAHKIANQAREEDRIRDEELPSEVIFETPPPTSVNFVLPLEMIIQESKSNANIDLIEAGGYTEQGLPVPTDLFADVYAYYHYVASNTDPDSENLPIVQEKKNQAIARAKAHKEAREDAIAVLSEQGGWLSEREIPPLLIKSLYDSILYLRLNPSRNLDDEHFIALKIKADEALLQTKEYKARNLAIELLREKGGYTGDIPEELIKAVTDLNLRPSDASEADVAVLQAAYDSALSAAQEHQRLLTTNPGTDMATEKHELVKYKAESLSTAMVLQGILNAPITSQRSRTLSSLDDRLNELGETGKWIYRKILRPERYVAENSRFVSFWHGYSEAEWKSARKQCSRLIDLLNAASVAFSSDREPNGMELDLINQFLIEGVRQMCEALPWVNERVGISTFMRSYGPLPMISSIGNGLVVVSCPAAQLAEANRRLAQLERDLQAERAARVAAEARGAAAEAREATAAVELVTAAERVGTAEALERAVEDELARTTVAHEALDERSRAPAANNPHALFTSSQVSRDNSVSDIELGAIGSRNEQS